MATITMDYEEIKNRTPDDLTLRFTQEYLDTLIEDAVALVDHECPSLASRLAAGAFSPSVYKRRIADIVLRVTNNTGGFISESEGGASYTLSPVVASGNIWLTQADLDLFNGVKRPGFRMPGSISIGLDRGYVSPAAQ